MQIDFIFLIAILMVSVILHEISHGYAAYISGDPTAKYAGRLTLNPLKHLEIFGSIILPVITYLMGGFILGWAKPVPFNPYNLKNQKWGTIFVGIAGIAANLTIAITFGMIIRFSGYLSFIPISSFKIISNIVYINLLLAVFNLMPVPPLDGSKIFSSLLPWRWQKIQLALERYSFIFILIFIFFIWPYVFLPIASLLFNLITGISVF